MGKDPLQPTTYNPQPTDQKGLLISFDGTDSSGKETQANRLAERLRRLDHTVWQFTTPDYDMPSGRELKARLQGKLGDWAATPWTEKLNYFARNRAEHREEVVAALTRGEIVIYDRYIPSSCAFITVEARGEDPALDRADIQRHVKEVEYEQNEMPREDVSIFLDMPPRTSAELLEKRKKVLAEADEYTDHVHVQEQLYNEYDLLCRDDPSHYLRVPCIEGGELLSINAVADLIWLGLKERFPKELRDPVAP